jgi:hypothetical protein
VIDLDVVRGAEIDDLDFRSRPGRWGSQWLRRYR